MDKERIETYKKLYKQVAELQDKFNSVVSPNWKKERKLIDWVTAFYVEGAELIDSLPWKWWKKMSQPDIENIKIEIVDLFHFILSQAIQVGLVELTDGFAEVLSLIDDNKKKIRQLPEEERRKYYSSQKFIRELTALLVSINGTMTGVSEDISEEHNHSVIGHAMLLFENLVAQFMDFEELCKLYIGKNALNKIRQDFGYKVGTYIKEWKPGIEDNKVMIEIVESMKPEELTFDEVYKRLADYYTENVAVRG